MSRLEIQNIVGYSPRYLVPHPLAVNQGPVSASGIAPGFTPIDGFWHPDGVHLVLMAEGASAVYRWSSRDRNFVRHSTFAGGRRACRLHPAGDRVAALGPNVLATFVFDPVAGTLAADAVLTDSVRFSHPGNLSWDHTGEFIITANDNSAAAATKLAVIRYVRTPPSLTVVAEWIGVFGEDRKSVDWNHRHDVIMAGGTQLGQWLLTFDRVTNTLTRVINLTGTWREFAGAWDPTGEFYVHCAHDVIGLSMYRAFRYTPGPHALTHVSSITPPNAGGGAPGAWIESLRPFGLVTWDWESRTVFFNTGVGVDRRHIPARFDPATLSLSLLPMFPKTVTANISKYLLHPRGSNLVELQRRNVEPAVHVLPWSSYVHY